VEDISVKEEVGEDGGLGVGVNMGVCHHECLRNEEAIVPR
jgi:hypothetical protein